MKVRIALLCAFVAAVASVVPLIGPSDGQAASLVVGRARGTFQPRQGKVFVLVIGNDARSGNPDRSLADAIHLVGINTRTMKGGILNFPRDSWVSIPGSGAGRINEALFRGGPELLARTVHSVTGIRPDYWVMVGFDGFQDIIRDIGPVTMTLPRAIYDPYGSGANLKAGRQPLGAVKSLAFVRTRKVFLDGDVARTTNQGRYLLALLRKFRGEIDRKPASLLRWMTVTRRHARLNVGAGDLYRLGVLASQVRPADVGNVTLPVSIGTAGAASVVFIQDGARTIYERFRRTGAL
jgi:polyisoprenyl-teichoic acid--peptidoglycan teichoic acid transferase